MKSSERHLLIIDHFFDPKKLSSDVFCSFDVIFCSDDLIYLEELENYFRENGWRYKVFQPKKVISKIAERERDQYVNFINELSDIKLGANSLRAYYQTERFGSLWYYTYLYEKNTLVFNSFHHYCLFRFAITQHRILFAYKDTTP